MEWYNFMAFMKFISFFVIILFHKHLLIMQPMDFVLKKQRWEIVKELTAILGIQVECSIGCVLHKASEGFVSWPVYQVRLPVIPELSLKKAGGMS
jgi:hypothetical protein